MATFKEVINSYEEKEESTDYLKEGVNYLDLYREYVWKRYHRIHMEATEYANINTR